MELYDDWVNEVIRADPENPNNALSPGRRESVSSSYNTPEEYWEELDDIGFKLPVVGPAMSGAGTAQRMALFSELDWDEHRTFFHFYPEQNHIAPVIDGQEYGLTGELEDPEVIPAAATPDIYRVGLAAEELVKEDGKYEDLPLKSWAEQLEEKYADQPVQKEFYRFMEEQAQAMNALALKRIAKDALEEAVE